MSLSWSVVEIVGDLVASGLGDGSKAGAAWQVLTKQPVEILVATALPRVIRRGEVDLDRKTLLEDGVVVKLGAVVEGEGLEVATVLADRSGGGASHLASIASPKLL